LLQVGKDEKMNIPNSVIYVVGDVLGSWYYSHSKLDTLFGGNGFPGDPPAGNCVAKCQAWLRRANDTPDCEPLDLLGRVLIEFMNMEDDDEPRRKDAHLRVTKVLAQNGYAFEVSGSIVALSASTAAEAKVSAPEISHIVQPNPQQHIPTPSTATTAPTMSTQPNKPTLVLVTVNDNETHALLDAFVGVGSIPAQTTKGGVTYNELGIHGGYRLINTICEMGAGGVGASQQRTREAIEHWHPKAIIAVGIAFGLDESKQKIGDVLVATQIQDYDLGRLNKDGTLTPRGDKPSSADPLRNRLRQTDAMQTRLGNGWPKVRFGPVLSGQKLVDNLDYRESLKAIFTEAIGGEMEGTGVYVSASAAKVDWIVVKAICDWGHEKSQADKDAWQKLAAKNAAQVLKAALEGEGLYSVESSHTAMGHEAFTHPTTPNQTAQSLWQKKLEYLHAEQAVTADAEMKFSIQHRIEEAKAKIQELGGKPQ
jgi:nucleoside phosphorylase